MPLDEKIDCPASNNYTKAYIHHLVRSGELLGSMILSWHNIAYYQDLMSRMRVAISSGEFDSFITNFRLNYTQT